MRPLEQIAEAAAAAAAAYTTASAGAVPCGAHRKNWSALEHDYVQADRHERALTLTMIREVCRPCPAPQECATWATLDQYTGFAGGSWYDAGRRTSPPRSRASITRHA